MPQTWFREPARATLIRALPARTDMEPACMESPAEVMASVTPPGTTCGGIVVRIVLLSRVISSPSC